MLCGLTSITFRKLDYKQIIKLARDAELDGIEWGGDIHCLPGDTERARIVKEDTIFAGLSVLSYGSYYRAGDNDNPEEAFAPVLETAKVLNAPVIRIWAGKGHSEDCTRDYFNKVVRDTRIVCEMAARYNILICYEYHAFTLNDNCESSLRLLNEVKCDNLKTYWQPNQFLSAKDNLRELKAILNFLQNIHVFHWNVNERLELESGYDIWNTYVSALENDFHNLILEFVKDDSPGQFSKDAKTLKKLIENSSRLK